MKSNREVGVAVMIILSAAGLAGAQIEPVADAFLDMAVPGANRGYAEIIGLWNNVTNARKSYIRYNLSDVTNTIETASLSLTQLSVAPDPGVDFPVEVYGLNDADPGELWYDETSIAIDWENAPQNDTGTTDGLLSGVTHLGTLILPGGSSTGTVHTFSSPTLVGFLNADTDNSATIILTHGAGADANSSASFASKENTEGYDPVTLAFTQLPGLVPPALEISPAADARIAQQYPNNKYGADPYIEVNSNPNGNAQKSYIRYDLSGVTNTNMIRGARLALTQSKLSASRGTYIVDVYGLNDGDAGEAWVDSGASGIRWNTAPQNDTNSASALFAGTTYLGRFAFDSAASGISTNGQVHEFFSVDLVDFLNTDTDDSATLILVYGDPGAGILRYHSKENTGGYAPATLTLTLSEVPPPEIGDVSIAIDGSYAIIGWNGTDGLSYALQSKDDLVSNPSWSNEVTGISGVDGSMSTTSTTTAAESFYRLIVE